MEKLIKLQLALFFENPVSRPDSLMNGINSDLGNLFDAMPQIHPIPMEAPQDIPRVQMSSENGRYNCNIASSRIDFILSADLGGEFDWPEITKDFIAKTTLFINSVFSGTKIVRFGLIGNFFIPDKSASSTLTRKYLKIDLNSAEEINLRFNKNSSSYGLSLNNISSINTAIRETNEGHEKGVFIELDINNIPKLELLKSDTLVQLIEKHMPLFSPEKVKGLIK